MLRLPGTQNYFIKVVCLPEPVIWQQFVPYDDADMQTDLCMIFNVRRHSRTMKWLFNSFMLWGAVLRWLIVSSAFHLLDTARHKGPGVVHYGDGERSPEWSEKVAESQYKRHNYVMSGMMLSLGFFLWVTVARTARNEAPTSQTNDRNV
jgi:hypothetical protein